MYLNCTWGRRGRDRMVARFRTLPLQSVPITTKNVSSNSVHGKVYSMHHYKNVFNCQTAGRWFSPGTPVSSTNRTAHHDIAEILLKVALNTVNITLNCTLNGIRS